MEPQACEPWTVSPSLARRSLRPGLFSMVFAMRPSLEPQPVGVAVVVVALVLVAVAGGQTGLAEEDDARRAPVDAQGAPGADVLVHHEDHVVVGVRAGSDGVRALGDGLGGEHVDALPRTDVDAALAH